MFAARRDVERAEVAVEIREALGHLDKDVEIIGIGQSAHRAAMRRDARDAALQGKFQDVRIGKFRADDFQNVFATRVRE